MPFKSQLPGYIADDEFDITYIIHWTFVLSIP